MLARFFRFLKDKGILAPYPDALSLAGGAEYEPRNERLEKPNHRHGFGESVQLDVTRPLSPKLDRLIFPPLLAADDIPGRFYFLRHRSRSVQPRVQLQTYYRSSDTAVSRFPSP